MIKGTKVFPRLGSRFKRPGLATGGSRMCGLESCRGEQIGVRWPNGKLTWCCTKGLRFNKNGSARIL